MHFDTRFSLGDEVHVIRNEQTQVWHPCDLCQATGYIPDPDPDPDPNTRWCCPKCGGHRGRNTYEPSAWMIAEYAAHVASVHVSATEEGREEGAWPGITYMLRETGCPSGTVHREANLCATVAEAQAECDKRNAEQPDEEVSA